MEVLEALDEPQDSEDSDEQHFTFNLKPPMEDLTSNCLTLVEAKIGLPSVVVNESETSESDVGQKKLKKSRKKSSISDKRSKSFHSQGRRPSVIIPRLQIEESPNEASNPGADTASDNTELPGTPTEAKPRKRRKSLVNLLFLKGSSSSVSSPEKKQNNSANNTLLSVAPPNTVDTDNGSSGQRLHFRRLSDFMCNKNIRKQKSVMRETSKDDCNFEVKNTKDFLSQLFPHRRRRSSVTHLDNTPQFRETKEEYLEATRRRMSSFPPCDGDESALMLEKIHYLSNLEEHNATTPVSESKSPLKLLKKACLDGKIYQHCLKITQNVSLEFLNFWHFPPIFVVLKVTCKRSSLRSQC